jgi:hypothetical protein
MAAELPQTVCVVGSVGTSASRQKSQLCVCVRGGRGAYVWKLLTVDTLRELSDRRAIQRRRRQHRGSGVDLFDVLHDRQRLRDPPATVVRHLQRWNLREGVDAARVALSKLLALPSGATAVSQLDRQPAPL